MMHAEADEKSIGIEVFYTDTKGTGGRLRKTAEDFIVDEVSLPPPPSKDGEYTIARIRARNWETNRLVRQLSRQLAISRKRIGFAGTKDRRAVTTLLISIKAPQEDVRRVSLKDLEFLEMHTSERNLALGNLLGNRFEIVIREFDYTKGVEKSIEGTLEQLETLGGFPNFFGHQRFGALRPVTHLVGRRLIEGDFEAAVKTYLGHPVEIEGEEAFSARSDFQEGSDCADALKKYPVYLGFERAMLHYLVKNRDDYVGAIDTLPKNLSWMFVHAYQSFLFNRILSRRIQRGILEREPFIGDIVLPADINGLPDHKKWIDVTQDNLDKVRRRISEGRAFVSGLVPGTDVRFAQREQGEIEREVLEEEGLSSRDFAVPEMRELSSKGIRRELVAPFKEFGYEVTGDCVIMRFELFKGCYATALLREFMKTAMLNY